MLLRFSKELECNEEENCKNNLDLERCCKCVMMRRNMMDLMLRQELNSEGQLLTKSNSQKQLEILKNSKKDKKDKKNEEIFKNQNDIKEKIIQLKEHYYGNDGKALSEALLYIREDWENVTKQDMKSYFLSCFDPK